MVAALWWVLRPSSYEYFAVVCLNWAESNRNIEVDVEQLARLLVNIDQVIVDRPLVEFEIVNPVSCLANTLAVITEARTTINLRDGSLHEVTLTTHELASWTVSHRGYSCTKCSSVLLHIRSWVAEVFIYVALSLVAPTIVVVGWSLWVWISTQSRRITIEVLTVVIPLTIELPTAIQIMLLSSRTSISTTCSIAVVVASSLVTVLRLVLRVTKVVPTVTTIFVIELLLLHENTV